MKLKTIDVRGLEIDVHVGDDGSFSAYLTDNTKIDAPSLVELTEKLNRATKAVKVAVPFLSESNGKVRLGTCTGKHASNRNYLVKWEDGENDQVSGWDLEKVIDPKHREEYQKLSTAAYDALHARLAFEKAHRLNARATVDAELENAYRTGVKS